MSDDFDEPIDDAEDERVRALLADLGPAGPIPASVSDRISAALDDLPAPAPPPVRLTRAGRWVVAAAAVVVVGGGGTLLVHGLDGSGSSASTQGSGLGAADSAGSSRAEAAPSRTPSASIPARRTVPGAGRIAVPAVSSKHFVRDVAALLDERTFASRSGTSSGTGGADALGAAQACTLPSPLPAHTRPSSLTITYDGTLAQLLVSGTRPVKTARVYNCAGTKVLNRAKVTS